VICCARLGKHSETENRNEAAAPLAKADQDSVKHLRTLFGMKTKAGYSHTPVTTAECRRAGRAAEALLDTARRVHATGATYAARPVARRFEPAQAT
jgi:methylphosphotriester-DNA--protein-cysteine methyltransferase